MAADAAVRRAERRAISRALALGLAGEVERVEFGWYRLPSTTRPGQVRTVRVVGGRYICDCEAGRSGRGRPCAHAAAVYIRKIQAGGATVVAPAAPSTIPAPVPANVVDLRARRAA